MKSMLCGAWLFWSLNIDVIKNNFKSLFLVVISLFIIQTDLSDCNIFPAKTNITFRCMWSLRQVWGFCIVLIFISFNRTKPVQHRPYLLVTLSVPELMKYGYELFEDPFALMSKEETNTITFFVINDTKKDLDLIVWTQTNLAATTAHSDPLSLLVPEVPQGDCDAHMRNRRHFCFST